MVAVEANHDTGSKTFLGVTLPAKQLAEQDLSEALGIILYHPNVAPFVSRQLIQHLVTSNPSPAYVERVATAFKESGGDMMNVISAILLDSEARAGDSAEPTAGFGHLREPVLYINGLLRGLGASVTATSSLASQSNALGQNVYYPPSVFSYFSPQYRFDTGSGATLTSVNAPEIQLLSGATAILRTSFVNTLIFGSIGGVTVDLTRYESLTSSQMVAALDVALLGGRLSSQATASIVTAVNAQTSAKAKAQTAAYLVATSSQYQVER